MENKNAQLWKEWREDFDKRQELKQSTNTIMNIFYLDKRPDDAAEMHCDKHVCKMLIEYAQLMSTAHQNS